jgi:hypothetical protein
MKRSLSKHDYVAIIAILAWVAVIVVMILNRDTRSAVVPVLLCSVATMVGAVLLSRYWIKRESVPSFGSLIVVPLACAFLFVFGSLFWEACRYDEWYLFTPSYWQQAKGGFRGLIFPFGVLWGVCIFPATAIILYFQRYHDADKPKAVQPCVPA